MDDGWRSCGTCHGSGAVDGEDCPRCLGECRSWEPVEDPYAKPTTPRDPAYLRWLRAQPCAFCARPPPSEVSHHGRHGIGVKPSDHLALPACRECHARYHASGSPHARYDEMTPDARRELFAAIAATHRARHRSLYMEGQ